MKTKIISYLIILVNLFDIIVHIVIQRPETLRITGNIILIIAFAVYLLETKNIIKPWMLLASGLINLVLNLVFIYLYGIGFAGVVFISSSTILTFAAYLFQKEK